MDPLIIQALAVASALGRAKPSKRRKAAFAAWQTACRTVAYQLCINAKVISEADFYAASNYED